MTSTFGSFDSSPFGARVQSAVDAGAFGPAGVVVGTVVHREYRSIGLPDSTCGEIDPVATTAGILVRLSLTGLDASTPAEVAALTLRGASSGATVALDGYATHCTSGNVSTLHPALTDAGSVEDGSVVITVTGAGNATVELWYRGGTESVVSAPAWRDDSGSGDRYDSPDAVCSLHAAFWGPLSVASVYNGTIASGTGCRGTLNGGAETTIWSLDASTPEGSPEIFTGTINTSPVVAWQLGEDVLL